MPFYLWCVLTFLLALVGDWVETWYVLSVGAGDRWRAAACSVGMWGVGAISLVAILEVSLWLMIPEVFGLIVGTVIAIPRVPPLMRVCKPDVPKSSSQLLNVM